MKIFRQLNVNSIEELIEIFNKEKFTYQSNYMQFNNLNKEIIDLNIIVTALEKDLQKIELNLRSKEFKEMMSGDYKSDTAVNNLMIILKESKISIEERLDKIAKIGKIFIKVKRDIISHDKFLNFIRKCITDMFLMKIKDKDTTKISGSKDVSSISSLKEKNKLDNSKVNSPYANEVSLFPNDSEWSEEQGKFLLLIFINNFFY